LSFELTSNKAGGIRGVEYIMSTNQFPNRTNAPGSPTHGDESPVPRHARERRRRRRRARALVAGLDADVGVEARERDGAVAVAVALADGHAGDVGTRGVEDAPGRIGVAAEVFVVWGG
jgi:hypothetical protein